ncbi:MAG: type II CAAX endopeptidase family protein [Pontiella sp.]
MEETSSILTAVLLIGGFIAAPLLYLQHQRNPPNAEYLTEIISERSWSTRQVVILLSTLFLLYFFAGFAGLFFYEEQIPYAQLAITLSIYTILTVMIGCTNQRNGGRWAGKLGMESSTLWKLCLAPIVYLAVIPFIILISVGNHLLVEQFSTSEVELQGIAEMVSGNLSGLQICYILTAIFAAPIYEELLFRGVLFPYCVRRTGLIPATVAVSALFAVLHYHLPSFAPLFALSVVLCLTYRRTGSLWTSIGVHMIFNAVSILALNISG